MPRGGLHVAKQLNAFSNQHGRHQRHAGNVPTGARQAGHYAGFDRVGRDYYNRDFTCCPLRRQCAGDIECHDDIDLEPEQLGRKLGKSIQLSFRRAKLKCNVLSLLIAKLTQPSPEFLLERLRVREPYVERTYSSHLGLLRVRNERPNDRSPAEQRNELAPSHELLPEPRATPTNVGVYSVFGQALCTASTRGSRVRVGSFSTQSAEAARSSMSAAPPMPIVKFMLGSTRRLHWRAR